MPDISMATVYNCLEALVKCGLARQFNLERGASRYCSNLSAHHHFHCGQCGATFDIAVQSAGPPPQFHLPAGFSVSRCEVFLRGVCPDCSGTARGRAKTRPIHHAKS
jgi:Fur family peroxide stress response transcriptional regulator